VITQVLLSQHWRSGGAPGTYTCRPHDAPNLKGELDDDPTIETVTLGNGFITISLTREALANIAVEVARAGQNCVKSDALRGRTVPGAAKASLASAPDWEHARAALAAELTATLAAAAGATLEHPHTPPPPAGSNQEIAHAIAFAGQDAVRFTLARTPPGTKQAPDPAIIARHVQSNPAYAVRYAHAAAVAVLRWARIDPADPELTRGLPGGFRPRQLAAARTGLAAGLGLLGITAPDRI
jgi:arginyl-tRNA synthetase